MGRTPNSESHFSYFLAVFLGVELSNSEDPSITALVVFLSEFAEGVKKDFHHENVGKEKALPSLT